MQELAISATTEPAVPYVGVRAYGFHETGIFTGRDVEVAQVGSLVANRARWRIILLHGQTGCGKSSFLKAGLIPEVTSSSLETTVFDRSGDGSYSRFITSSEDPMKRLAGVAVDLVRDNVPENEWPQWLANLELGTDLAQAAPRLAASAGAMARWFAALAPMLDRPLLLVIDQAEELFTLRMDGQAELARKLYFDFLADYCDRSSWIQILISMRTEFFGRFDDELRRRLGDSMPVAPYYLQSFSIPALETVVTEPLDRVFHTPAGQRYAMRFEEHLPRLVAETVAKRFPGPGALTCMQIVCVRLCEQALLDLPEPGPVENAGPVKAIVTHDMFAGIGDVHDVIEDVIDMAIGDFCDARHLTLEDSMRLWRTCKFALGGLVTQQSGGAPTTKFIVRKQFIDELAKRNAEVLPHWMRAMLGSVTEFQSPESDWQVVEKLVDHLLLPQVRVLREALVVEHGHSEPTVYLALGHDILSVGLAEAMARVAVIDQRQAVKKRRLLVKMVTIPVVTGVGSALIPLVYGLLAGTGIPPLQFMVKVGFIGLVISVYAVMLQDAFRSSRHEGEVGWWRLLENHLMLQSQTLIDHLAPRGLMKMLKPLALMRYMSARMSATGRLFRALTADARRVATSEGKAAFPGGARY